MKNWKVAVIGAGAMGRGIAQIAATYGHEVYLHDTSRQALNKSRSFLEKILNRQVEKQRMTDADAKAIFGRIYFIEEIEQLFDSNIVFEAIIEDLSIKKAVFAKLEHIVSEDCILSSNTSSLSITSIASAVKSSGRVLGIHFFNPAPLMRLVEVIPALQTDTKVVERATALIKGWGKTTVSAVDSPGFIVNRIARPFYSEALRIVDEGIASPPEVDHAMKEIGGFLMGPFELMDYIGHDVNFKVTEGMYNAFYQEPRYKPSFTQKRLVDAGWLGRKSGKGFYEYPRKKEKKEEDNSSISAEQHEVFNRILIMLINEAADALYLDVAAAEGIEMAMTQGVNYPKGLLTWANEIGISECVSEMDALYDHYREERYRCCPLLRDLEENGDKFTLQ